MSEIQKPSKLSVIWASGGDTLDPGDTKYTTGWQVEIPPRQWFNFLDNKQDQALAHINQFGVAVWDSETEYQANRSYTQGPTDGIIYRCVSTNTNQNPETDVSDTYWEVAFSNAGDFYTKTETDNKYLAKASNLSDLPNAATARANLSVYSQAQTYTKTEVDAKTTVASTAQAQAWTSNTTILTPLRLAEALKGSNLSTSNNGYQKLPSGLILQWGNLSSTGTGELFTVTLPIAFPTAILQVVGVEGAVSGWNSPPNPTFVGVLLTGSLSSFQASTVRETQAGAIAFEAGVSVRWFAIGY